MKLRLITPPTSQVVTTAEAKAHMRVDHSDDDTFIDTLIEGVTAHLDGQYGMLQRALNPQTWELVLDEFPLQDCEGNAWIDLPLAGADTTLDSVKYDLAGVETTIATTFYELDDVKVPARVRPVGPASWPVADLTVNPVRVRYTTGWTEESGASGVPSAIKAAIKIMVADLYENRETVTPGSLSQVAIPTTAKMLLSPYVIHAFA